MKYESCIVARSADVHEYGSRHVATSARLDSDITIFHVAAHVSALFFLAQTSMSFLSFSDVRSISTAAKSHGLNALEAKASTSVGSIFLSHSSADDEFVAGAVVFLMQFGFPVYTDNHDRRLPVPPNTQTAKILKDEIKKSRRFVVFVSPNSRFSRWIPWELGLADGYKDVVPIGILPVTSTGEEENWAKEEYFGLYPRIYKSGNTWYVEDPRDRKPWTLDGWMRM